MRHLKNFQTMSPEELLVNIEAGSSSEFIDETIKKIRDRYNHHKNHNRKRYKNYGK